MRATGAVAGGFWALRAHGRKRQGGRLGTQSARGPRWAAPVYLGHEGATSKWGARELRARGAGGGRFQCT
eukprot:112896-Alexandrium_andersonii.AAC.1